MDAGKAHKDYLTQQDWRVKENSNNISSFGAYQKFLVGEANAVIMREHVYGSEFSQYHDKGAIHIHDLSSGLCNYCFGGSLETLLSRGISEVPNLASSTAPNHFDSAVNQIASSILGFASEISGAVAYGDFNTYLAPLYAKDCLQGKMDNTRLEQSIQNLVFNLNQNTRFSSEPCFSNLTLNLRVPKPLKDKPVIGNAGISTSKFTYGDYEAEAEVLALKLLDVMLQGDARGNAFTYPLITINVASLEDLNSPVAIKACELSAKTGNCYFANFINSNLSADDTYSLCPLTADTEIIVRDTKPNSRVETLYIDTREDFAHEQSVARQIILPELADCNDKNVYILSIKEAVILMGDEPYLYANPRYEVFTPEGWKKCVPRVMPMTKVYRVHFGHECHIDMGENHLHPYYKDGIITTVSADKLEAGMRCPCTSTDYIKDNVFSGKADKDAELDRAFITSIEVLGEANNEPDLYCIEVIEPMTGLPLFLLANGMFTHNCRLRLDKKELIQKQGLFGAQANTGSIGVVTLSMPYIVREMLEEGLTDLAGQIAKYSNIASEILEKKRKVITERLQAGFYPHLKGVLPRGFDTFFSTIGLLGVSEAYPLYCELVKDTQLRNVDYTSSHGKAWAIEVIDAFVEVSKTIQEKTGNLYNIEATPAESASYSLARKYNKKYATTSKESFTYFTNSSNLDVSEVTGISKAVSFYNGHLSKYTGGSVYHILCDDSKISGHQVSTVVGNVFKVSDIPYVSITPMMYTCLDHGRQDTPNCPVCGGECEILTRVTGFIRPVSRYNAGKQREHAERVYITLGNQDESK